MQFASIVVAAGIGLGCCALADAGTRAGNGAGQAGADRGADWSEAQSLRELPPGVQVLLGVGLAPHDGGIADRGESIQPGDAFQDGTPARRFVLGLVSGNRAVVALEQGGSARQFKAVEFRQAGTTWEPVRCIATHGIPQRGAELLDAVAGSRAPAPCSLSGVLPSGAAGPSLQAPLQAPIQAPVKLRPGA